LIVDEAHHASAQSYRTVIGHFLKNETLLLVGVTATPNRADGQGLGEIFQEIVADRDILFGIRNGWLAELRGIRIRTGVHLNHVHTKAIDFDQGELGMAVNTAARNDMIARTWLEHAQERQTVVFAVDVQHARDVAAAFKRYGVAAEAIWGDDPERGEKLNAHRQGAFKVLVNCQLLTEGYDDWKVSCIGIGRPTQSEGLYVQMTGRGTRIPNNISNILEARIAGQKILKDDCILLDFVDVTSKHSLVTLASLFGMKPDADLRGRAITEVAAGIEQAKKINHLLDLTRVDDITKLQSYAEQVDLFKGAPLAEIIQFTEYPWHRTGENAYVVALMNNESVVVIRDILDRWHIRGSVNRHKIQDVHPTFDDAIREADFKVGQLGGKAIKSIKSRIKEREAKWHQAEPTRAQLMLCRRMRIQVPPGATKGEVAMKLTQEIQRRKEARAAEKVT
jgi:hypothetical protein